LVCKASEAPMIDDRASMLGPGVHGATAVTKGPVLEAIDVVRWVRDGDERRIVLRGVSMRVDAGEVVVVTGPSGSGKTTLLGVLGGMLLPSAGEVRIEGESVSRLRDRHRAEVRRRKVGYLFQDLALVAGMTALENVQLPMTPDGIDDRSSRAVALDRLRQFGVEGRALDRVDGLSGGERQRVALARALVRSPSAILLDEPTAHLDATLARRLFDDLVALASRGAALVLSSHDPRVLDDERVTRVHRLVDGALS
jgi:putative ABC transport system ATP-binding protein